MLDDRDWMAYIDGEVRAVCQAKGWGHQIRRKWSVREKPVSESPIDDYEWKLLPPGNPPEGSSNEYDGTYYVVWFNRADEKFFLQHDTSHCGVWGPDHERATFSEIRFNEVERLLRKTPPRAGWLRDHLKELVERFAPNHFCVT